MYKAESSFFQHRDYRSFIRAMIDHKKDAGERLTHDQVATSCGVQKAYFSKVLSGHADLSQDQLFKLIEYLGIGNEEARYLELLLEQERTSIAKRRVALKKRSSEVRQNQIDQGRYLNVKQRTSSDDFKEYYTDPYTQIVHLSLLIPRYREVPDVLMNELGIPPHKGKTIMERLRKLGFLEIKDGKLKVLAPDLHLTREAEAYPATRHMIRTLSGARLQQLEKRDAFSFSATFTTDVATRDKIQALFMEFLQSVKVIVDSSGREQCVQMNFDLIPWTEGSDREP